MSGLAEADVSVIEVNRRVFAHEVETDPRGHDANGACCLRARLTPIAALDQGDGTAS